MGILKLLFLVAVGWVIYSLFRSHQRSLQRPDERPPAQREAEDMVRCAHCGVNVPRSEAIFSKGEFFCTPEHHRLGRK